MKYYYALFKNTNGVVEVEFPDLVGCSTFGENWDDALDKAEDALAAWLSHAEPKFIKKASKYHELSCKNGELVPIPINEKIKVADSSMVSAALSPRGEIGWTYSLRHPWRKPHYLRTQ